MTLYASCSIFVLCGTHIGLASGLSITICIDEYVNGIGGSFKKGEERCRKAVRENSILTKR
ncbi:exported protein of unknown function [Candidatus Filomicrobium marinum]|uniref:Uncharacterized protein n=1 Tax=Candidatus Filomicrobium marinum TaxID=1608628 RepID=A0A0D6JIY9_9HYPH|nr:exported protein of unknown function [Candidatus Filomicrobium marinum]